MVILTASCSPANLLSIETKDPIKDNSHNNIRPYSTQKQDEFSEKNIVYVSFIDDAFVRPIDGNLKQAKAFKSLNKELDSKISSILSQYGFVGATSAGAHLSELEANELKDKVNSKLKIKHYQNLHSKYFLRFKDNTNLDALSDALLSTGLVNSVDRCHTAISGGTNLSTDNQFGLPPSDPIFSTYNDSAYFYFNRHAVFEGWEYYNYFTGSASPRKVAVIEVGKFTTQTSNEIIVSVQRVA
jgi:hypothetical protein